MAKNAHYHSDEYDKYLRFRNPAETGFLKRSTYPVAAWRMNEP